MDTSWRCLVVPIAATNNDGGATDVVAIEAEVLKLEGSVGIEEGTIVTSNVAVISDLMTRHAPQIVAEATQARVPLLEDNRLSLDFTDLFGDDPLRHLLENNELLLDDFDSLRMADDLMLLLDDHLTRVGAVEVVATVEIVEVIQRRESSPVTEGWEIEAPGREFK